MCYGLPCCYGRSDGGCSKPRGVTCTMEQDDITDDDQRDGDDEYDGDDLK